MELILLEKVKNLGDLGDKVKVKPGYGRNYLLPQGKAVRTTAANMEAFEQRRAEYEAKAKKLLADAEARKAALDGTEIIISAHASPEGKLYGSVGPREIAEAMAARNLEVDKGEIVQPEGAIRNTGEYKAHIALHADVQASIKITVNAD